MIVQAFTLVEELRDTWPLLVLISLEEREDPCKTGGTKKLTNTVSNLLFHGGVWYEVCKPCMWVPKIGVIKKVISHKFTVSDKICDTLSLIPFISLQGILFLFLSLARIWWFTKKYSTHKISLCLPEIIWLRVSNRWGGDFLSPTRVCILAIHRILT